MKKPFVILGAVIPVVLVATGITTYFLLKNKSSSDEITVTTSTEGVEVEYFPDTIDFDALYDEIRIENGQPVITDDFIALAIKEILSGASITESDIQLGWEQEDPQTADISFRVPIGNDEYSTKTYHFDISV